MSTYLAVGVTIATIALAVSFFIDRNTKGHHKH